jgi:septal ring factor EnvC (AmiA/AmiB activator)
MIRLFLIFAFLSCTLFSKENIDLKINKTSNQLASFSKNYTNINKKMAQTAKDILKQKRELEKQNKYLKQLQDELAKKEISYDSNTQELKKLKQEQKKLTEQQNKIENELVYVIAQSVSLSIILEGSNTVDEESLIESEVLKKLLIESKAKVKKLNSKFYKNVNHIETLAQEANSLEKAISSIDTKRKKILKTHQENKKALKKLQIAKKSYKKELQKLLKKQDTLKKTLAQLNIIKIDEEKKRKLEKERKAAFKRKKIALNENLPKVKKHGSSYQSVKTKRYKGPKTIAPLDSYTITKKYGTYTDPIYGIKIFNESISLKPKKAEAKVKTVFNGKVIYADKTAVLDNIVIVEHKNGLHTIYANLSQISPNIKKGKKIKKGYTIGRVHDELIFDVTQKSYHINPNRLFK